MKFFYVRQAELIYLISRNSSFKRIYLNSILSTFNLSNVLSFLMRKWWVV